MHTSSVCVWYSCLIYFEIVLNNLFIPTTLTSNHSKWLRSVAAIQHSVFDILFHHQCSCQLWQLSSGLCFPPDLKQIFTHTHPYTYLFHIRISSNRSTGIRECIMQVVVLSSHTHTHTRTHTKQCITIPLTFIRSFIHSQKICLERN